MTHQDAEEFGHAPNEPHDPQGRPVKSSKPIESKDCELDAKTKKALYRDDFESLDAWKNVCDMLGVPTSADQIYFNVKEVSYGG